MESACEAFGVPGGKAKVEKHGIITSEYVEYNRRDVALTVALLEKLLEEFRQHPINLSPEKTYSPASLAKAYLEAMGITPPREKFDLSPDLLGQAIGGYSGGRSEVRIRCVPVPVVYVDFLSMYPTVNSLMGLWRFIVADRLRVEEATEEVRALLERVRLDGCFDPKSWTRLPFFAFIEPDEDILPIRGAYDPSSPQLTIGSNYLIYDEGQWFPGPDLVASTLLTGKPPRVLSALRLVPEGIQSGLEPVKLAGEIEIDPARDDFFRKVIEERKRLEHRDDLSDAERRRLDLFLKILANAGSYGIYAEMNRIKLRKGEEETVTVYGRHGPFEHTTAGPEEPGVLCFPPIAALITSAARLMLAMLERCVTHRGGTYAFCDTDSMAIVAAEGGGLFPCPGGKHSFPDGTPAVRTLSWPEVDEILGRFESLNPYDRKIVPGSILEIEAENFEDCDPTAERVHLMAYAISAKRYVLFWDRDGELVVQRASEHGLGHLLNPTDPDSESPNWIVQLWERILHGAF